MHEDGGVTRRRALKLTGTSATQAGQIAKGGDRETAAPSSLKLAAGTDPWKWVYYALLAGFIGFILLTFATNERLRWDVVWRYLFHPDVLIGLGRTILITVLAVSIGTLIGMVTAVMLSAKALPLRLAAFGYVWFFRATPLLVQLVFWYNISLLFPTIGLTLPFGIELFSVETNAVVTVWVAAFAGMAIYEGAYMAEIIRGSLLAVGRGQKEAALAVGMTGGLMFRRVIAPQAIRVAIPPTGNQVINAFKATALLSVMALPELFYTVQLIYSQNFLTIPLLLVASLWYLLIGSILIIGQRRLERHFGKSESRSAE